MLRVGVAIIFKSVLKLPFKALTAQNCTVQNQLANMSTSNNAFSEILRVLEPVHILDLIEVGQINTPESICEAYNAIVKKIIFDGATDFNMATFNKVEAYVKNLKNQSNDVSTIFYVNF